MNRPAPASSRIPLQARLGMAAERRDPTSRPAAPPFLSLRWVLVGSMLSGKDPDSRRISELVSELISRVGRKRARQLVSTGCVGRPPGSGIDDTAALRHMADLVHRGEPSERQAALDSVHLTTGNSLPSTRDRLRGKFRRNRKALMKEAAKRNAAPKGSDDASLLDHLPENQRAIYLELMQHEHDREQAIAAAVGFADLMAPLKLETFEEVERELRRQLGLAIGE